MSDSPIDFVLRAAAFASRKHAGQARKGAPREKGPTPYINHPLAAAALLSEHGVADPRVLAAALLHDTIEDTGTTQAELAAAFGDEVAAMVAEVTDDKSLPKAERKLRQIEHAPHLSPGARLVKLADKICNLRDVADDPPSDWPLARRQEYYDWAARVVAGLRGAHAGLEKAFDEALSRRPL